MYGLNKEWAIHFWCDSFIGGVRQGIVFIVTHLMLQTINYKAFRMINCAMMI